MVAMMKRSRGHDIHDGHEPDEHEQANREVVAHARHMVALGAAWQPTYDAHNPRLAAILQRLIERAGRTASQVSQAVATYKKWKADPRGLRDRRGDIITIDPEALADEAERIERRDRVNAPLAATVRD